jgi:hypothetical protein
MRDPKLRSILNSQGTLKQKNMKQTGLKKGLSVQSVCTLISVPYILLLVNKLLFRVEQIFTFQFEGDKDMNHSS